MAYIISQVSGILVFIFAFISMQAKNIKTSLLCQIFCNGLGMVSYVLTDGFSGFGIYLIATIQSAVFFFLRKSGKEEPRWIYPFIFIAYIACSLMTFTSALDIVPMIAALLCALALIQKKPNYYRIIVLSNGALWVVYDLFIVNYAMLASHIFIVGSAIWGIVYRDVLKK